MSVQFILGRSGTGKSIQCIKEIIRSFKDSKEHNPLLLLVPEQATYQAERAILNHPDIPGYGGYRNQKSNTLFSSVNVISFSRLQFLLFKKRTAKPQISRIGRQMAIQKILQDNQKKLKLLATSVNLPGLSQILEKTIQELHQYDKGSEDIESLIEKLKENTNQKLSALKFHDIAIVLEQYQKFIEQQFIDPAIQLRLTQKAIEKNQFLKNAKLWVDGFSSFTNTQLNILMELMKKSQSTKIALCLDPEQINLKEPVLSPSPAKIFYQTEQTYAQLLNITKQAKLKIESPRLLKNQIRLKNNKTLKHIEKNIFEPNPPKISSQNNIKICSAPDARAEVKFVAKEILKLVRNNEYRYRDIAVIVSDIESYQHYIKAYFEDYSIPFFIDQRKFLSQHPLANLIISALNIIINDFNHQDIFAYLKNNLVPTDRNDVDLLENYCLAFGVKSDDWKKKKEWDFAAGELFDEEKINQIRKNLSTPILNLKENLYYETKQKKIRAGEFVKAIHIFLTSLNIPQTLNDWAQEEQEDFSAPDEHSQFYNNILDLFDELLEVFGNTKMTPNNYFAVLKAAFSQLTLAFIPPKLDEALIGSIERSRHPDLKAVFLMGATQNQFPEPVNPSGLLTDQDREAAETANFSLAPDTSTLLAERQYLAYIALTRPSEKLYITFPAADQKANPIVRSQFIDQLAELFENIKEINIKTDSTEPEDICSKAELIETLCYSLGKDNSGEDKNLQQLFCQAQSDDFLEDSAHTVRSALGYQNKAKLPKNLLKQLFPETVKSSATRLAAVSACPYRFFAKYILELKQRKEFKFEPIDLGDFYHRVLDRFITRLRENNLSLKTTDNKTLLEILRKQISKIITEDNFISRFKEHSSHNTFLINSAGNILEELIPSLAEMAGNGKFENCYTELAFGKIQDARQNIPGFQVKLSDNQKISIRGKLDRLDSTEINGQNTAIIFDYKLNPNKTSFNWSKFFHGLDLQLPIYILAVKNPENNLNFQNVAGAFYIPIEPETKSTEPAKLQKKQEKFQHKAKGIFNGSFAFEIDDSVETGWSKFYNFRVSKDKKQYGNYGTSGVLKPVDFDKFLKFAEQKIVNLAQLLLSGHIEVSPYKLGSASPCSYCEFRPVCRFDWNINDYRYLQSQSKKNVLEYLNEENRKK